MSTPGQHPGGQRAPDDRRSLRHVRAAQLRNKAIRWGIGKAVLGTVFLLGALSHAYGPDPHAGSTRVWMAGLVVLSTLYVGLGLRTFARLRRRKGRVGAGRLWIPATVAWGALSALLVRILLER